MKKYTTVCGKAQKKAKLATNKLRPMKDKSDISLSFRFLKKCSFNENFLILHFLKKNASLKRYKLQQRRAL